MTVQVASQTSYVPILPQGVNASSLANYIVMFPAMVHAASQTNYVVLFKQPQLARRSLIVVN